MNAYKLLIILLISNIYLFGQDIGTTEVKVLEGFNPAIPEAIRLNENAAFSDTIKYDKSQIYQSVDVNLYSDYKIKPLTSARVKDDKIFELYGTEVEVGFGSAFTTRSSIIHNSKRSARLSYGFVGNHVANKYSVMDSEFKNSQNNIYFYTKKINSSYILLVNLDYERRTAFHYDSKAGSLFSDDFFRNRFAYTKFSFSASSREKSESKLKHSTCFFISDLNELSENQIHLSSNLSKVINGLPFFLEIELNDYFRYNNDKKVRNTDMKVFSFSPATNIVKYGVDFDFLVDFDISSSYRIRSFPQVKATREFVKDVLLISAGLRHNQKRHMLKSLSEENPYIHSYGTNQLLLADSALLQELRFTNTQELYVFIRNVLFEDEVLEVDAAYGKVDDFAYFMSLDHFAYNRFQVAYVDVNQLHINARYYRKINQIISLNARVDYFGWDVDIYNKSNFLAYLKVPINLRSKIKISPNVNYMSSRKIMNHVATELPAQIHVDLDLQYYYSNQLSIYAECNNITNSKEDLWLGYAELGFNVVFGVNFSF